MQGERVKHTPGPWHYGLDKTFQDEMGHGPVGRFVSVYEDDPTDAICWLGDNAKEADGRLIADAPELLETLQMAERVIRFAAQESTGRVKSEIVQGWLYHANQVRNTIAKATGEQSPVSETAEQATEQWINPADHTFDKVLERLKEKSREDNA